MGLSQEVTLALVILVAVTATVTGVIISQPEPEITYTIGKIISVNPGGFLTDTTCLVETEDGKRFKEYMCYKYIVGDTVKVKIRNGNPVIIVELINGKNSNE